MPSGRCTRAADFLQGVTDEVLCLPTIAELKKRLRSREFMMPEWEISKVATARRRARNRLWSQNARAVKRSAVEVLVAKNSAQRNEIALLTALLAAEVAENAVLWGELGLERTVHWSDAKL